MMTEEIIPAIALSDFLVIFTPTYFNMPPALLKNFIDRCNVLLMLENRKPLGIATWISGQADECSLEACFRCLSSFAEVCEYTLIHECKILRIESCLNHTNILLADIKKLEKLAQIICP